MFADQEFTAVADPKKKKPKASLPKARGARVVIITMKGYPEFDEWLRRLATHSRLPASVLIEHALIEYARSHDFGEEAPER
jgi:hypothetical protein